MVLEFPWVLLLVSAVIVRHCQADYGGLMVIGTFNYGLESGCGTSHALVSTVNVQHYPM